MRKRRSKLIAYDSTSIWLFENFPSDRFFSGDIYRIDLGLITQKEAVTFYDNNTLVFTDEEFKGLIGGNAYKIELDKVAKQPIRTSSPSNPAE